VSGDDTIIVQSVSNSTGIASSRRIVMHAYSWGSVITNVTVDPNGLALTTTWAYYGIGSAKRGEG